MSMRKAIRVENGKYVGGTAGTTKASQVYMPDGVTSVADALKAETANATNSSSVQSGTVKCKRVGSLVSLELAIAITSLASSGTLICTVPENFRPTSVLSFLVRVLSNNVWTSLQANLATDGKLTMYGNIASTTSVIDIITFIK